MRSKIAPEEWCLVGLSLKTSKGGIDVWKVWNKLFGWDYIQWANFCSQGIARVHVDGAGRVFYWRYKSTRLADEVKTPEQVFWLTCTPDKYFPANEMKPE